MPKPTHEDAKIMLRLAEINALMNVPEAAAFIWGDDFAPEIKDFRAKFPAGSRETALVHRFLGWHETVGTLYRNGLINEDLLFDWLAVDLAWNRVKSFALAVRQESGEPRMFENFEYMARRSAQWQPARA